MPQRLLTDTCSALKLLALGDHLFKPGVFPLGDLIIHPRVLNETRRWDETRKTKYAKELAALSKIKATTDLRPPPKSQQRQQLIIERTIEELGLSVGRADVEQLVSAMHFDMMLVTNDEGFANAAVALDVVVHTAEQILIEALKAKVVTKAEARNCMEHWKKNREKRASATDQDALDALTPR